MKTVAVVCEYNPFHYGHKYQIQKIKEKFGEDTCIVCIMSGNYVQRGDLAILDKFTRAKIAVSEGASLVLELPFPYSMQSAEFFASSAIHIIKEAVKPDVLSFGCECADEKRLWQIAERLASKEFTDAFALASREKENSECGHPKLYENTYKKLYGDKEGAEILRRPNNILAIEYIKALIKFGYDAELHTVLRVGAEHDAPPSVKNEFESASAIRRLFYEGESERALSALPAYSQEICKDCLEKDILPTNISRLSNAILAFLRMNPPKENEIPFDCEGGLAHRLHKMSMQATDIDELITLVLTKRYTTARIRRAILNLYFGITSSDVRGLPNYTQVLSMDGKGREMLKKMKRTSSLEILTKPADYVKLSDSSRSQAERSLCADRIYSLAKPKAAEGNEFLRATPYCKK
ncbi:MAG: nucleotidyltransferase family protein [Clostridia bacterium]|nr:nucleotidyltransferase family protein [Clostridia bacterium]